MKQTSVLNLSKKKNVNLLMQFAFVLYCCFYVLPISAQSNAKSFIQMVEIPAGSFYMGSNGLGENFDEAPIHKVFITHSFRMGTTEITNAQYEAFDPQHRKFRGNNSLSSTEDDDAVVNVSYTDAVAFCKWLSRKEGKNYRLPTEAEWEYACRAGSYTQFSTGDNLPLDSQWKQMMSPNHDLISLKVAQSSPNAFGLYDMHGNVEEWCLDWYAPYSYEEQANPCGPVDGKYRVTRGGSALTPDKYLRSSNRLAMIPEDRNIRIGFRVVETNTSLCNYNIPENKPLNQIGLSTQNKVWMNMDASPVFIPPIPFVVPPDCNSGTPFYTHNHQPAITWCDNGDLLAIWFSTEQESGREMVVLASRLRNGNTEWDKASMFFKVPDRNMTGSALLNDKHGTLYHLNGVEMAGSWKNLVMTLRISHNNGATWSKPRIITPEHAQRHQVIAGTIYTREGWIIQACDAGPGGNDGAAIHISQDKGETWNDPWDGAPLPDFKNGAKGTTIAGIHAGIVQLKDGSIMALGRGNNILNKDGVYRMPMSISKDMGKTWKYKATSLPPISNGQRLVLMRLNEGPLLLVSFTDHPILTPQNERGLMFNDKDGNKFKGFGMYAALSYDEGDTWQIKRLITDGVYRFLDGGAWTGFFEMDKYHAEPRGYLAGCQTPDNMIHIISSRLHYRFNLTWLEQKLESISQDDKLSYKTQQKGKH